MVRKSDVPSIHELMGTGPFPRGIRYVINQLDPDIFVPWVKIDSDGEVDVAYMSEVFADWSKSGDDELHYACRPKLEGRHVHTSFCSIGGLGFYGADEGKIDEGASPFPPGIFGPKCTVRAGARLGGPFILGREVQVGSSHLSRAVVGCRTRFASNVTGGDFVAAPDVVVGAGVVLQSEPDDGSTEVVTRDFRKFSQPMIRTGRRRMGPIIGRGCKVYSSLRAGTILLPRSIVPMGMDLPAGIYTPEIIREMWEKQNKMSRFGVMVACLVSTVKKRLHWGGQRLEV